MKKTLSALLVLTLLLALMPAAMAGTYAAGTYTATAAGNNGNLTLSVTFSQDAITDIVIGEHTETESLAATPMARIPAAILSGQTLLVDTVSGATNTSKAILAAVADCVEQAGGSVDALMVPSAAVQAGLEQEELRASLVVVGGGTSGMSAAITAAQAGVDTLLIEKNPFLGGAGALSGGAVLVTGTKVQAEQGVSDDSPQLMIDDFLANGDNLNNLSMLTLYAQNISATVEWLMDDLGLAFQDGLSYQAEYQKDRVLYPVGAAAGLTQVLIDGLDNSGAASMMETRATDLIVEDGKVVGVKATGMDKEYRIYADAVLLATGGYGYAKDLLPESLQSVLYYGPTFSTGDGQKMAMAVNAQFDLFDLGKIYPNGVEVSQGTAKSTIWPNAAAFSVSGILVDGNGQRIVNEKASNNHLTEVLMQQPDQIMYLFMDAASFEGFRSRAAENSISDAEIDQWLKNNGSCAPLFAHGNTVDEAAAIAGIDADKLKATIERYNGFVAGGSDQDFDRPASFMNAAIGDGPYYIVEQKPRFATTMGGVVLTDDMEVTDMQGQVIDGLYACGEMANLVHGSNSPVGANVSWALTSGHLAGGAIARALSK